MTLMDRKFLSHVKVWILGINPQLAEIPKIWNLKYTIGRNHSGPYIKRDKIPH